MTPKIVLGVAVLLGGCWAGPPGMNTKVSDDAPGSGRVFIRLLPGNAPNHMVGRAEVVASGILASAGVELNWSMLPSDTNLYASPRIDIELSRRAPADAGAKVWANAAPYAKGGTRIHVFLDRIEKSCSRDLSGYVLGNVLAHEITHVLQGMPQHSEKGLMKAHWSASELEQMRHGPLSLTDHDIELIQSGIATLRRSSAPEELAGLRGR